jgi:diguanylate cyclase (GGDEF)-like protein
MIKKYIYLIVNLLLIIPGIVLVYSYAYTYIDDEVVRLEKKQAALHTMQDIYTIVTNLQKIRGLHNIHENSSKISDQIEALQKKNWHIANRLNNSEIKELLKNDQQNCSVDFQCYTDDIEALLLLYKLTAYHAKLTLNSDITEYLLSKNITNGLPYIVEYFARIRGLSSGVKNHQLKHDVKIRIKNQLYMIQELLKNTQEMKYFNEANFVRTLLNSQRGEIRYIDKEILNKDTIELDGIEIFNDISKNITFLNKLYDQNIVQLLNFYQNEITKKNFIKLLIIITCIISIIIIVLINLFYFAKIQKYIRKVEHLNIIDPMTKLYNRRFLENYIEQFSNKLQRHKESFAILMIDIDFFKKVNDTYGHDIGDKVIIATAKVLQKSIRKSDLAIRYGGEEFMVILHYADADAALKVATKIKEKFAKIEFQTEKQGNFHKTLSIGIATFPKDSNDVWKCIKLADSALYSAKTTGRDKVVIYPN